MEQQRWSGLSVVYVCPLKALLNNLLPRLEHYASWLGRRVAVWHADVTASARQRILREPPDVLLTTPESLEAMLIGLRVEHGRMFSDLRTIVIDEVHAFAGDDRAGTCSPCWSARPRSPGTPSSGSGCRPPSVTPPNCSAGSRAGGRARWLTPGISGASFELARAARAVLLGADPPVALTQRAKRLLAEVRDEHLPTVHPGGTVIVRAGEDVRWWTWAGYRANATLAATLSSLTDSVQRFDDASLRLRSDLSQEMWKAGSADAADRLCLPDIDERALAGLASSVGRSPSGWPSPPSPPAWPILSRPCRLSPSRSGLPATML